jgi:hypothetical protein
MTYERHAGVDAYLQGLPDWQRELCQELRDLVHDVDPDVVETVKRRVQPYFVLEGTVCALLAARDHVNLFLYDGAIVPDPDAIITARTIAFYDDDQIPVAPLRVMLTQIIANNRAGGWRKLKGQ